MQVLCVQFDIAWEDKVANFAKVTEMTGAAKPKAGSLIVLPEMFATGYSMDVAAIAEPAGGATEQFLAHLANKHSCYVIGGVAISHDSGKGANAAACFDTDGELLGRYCKMHPFSYAGEHEHFIGGDEPAVWQCGEIAIAPAICYDLRFPELFRTCVRRGADAFAVLANWPAARQQHWQTLLRARAIENQAYVIGVNRVGSDPTKAYAGQTCVIDPSGDISAEAGADECVVSAEMDLESLRDYRDSFPALRDMRNDL